MVPIYFLDSKCLLAYCSQLITYSLNMYSLTIRIVRSHLLVVAAKTRKYPSRDKSKKKKMFRLARKRLKRFSFCLSSQQQQQQQARNKSLIFFLKIPKAKFVNANSHDWQWSFKWKWTQMPSTSASSSLPSLPTTTTKTTMFKLFNFVFCRSKIRTKEPASPGQPEVPFFKVGSVRFHFFSFVHLSLQNAVSFLFFFLPLCFFLFILGQCDQMVRSIFAIYRVTRC